ncbi:MAG: hypothetical protein ACK559_38950, partial [bacterium]
MADRRQHQDGEHNRVQEMPAKMQAEGNGLAKWQIERSHAERHGKDCGGCKKGARRVPVLLPASPLDRDAKANQSDKRRQIADTAAERARADGRDENAGGEEKGSRGPDRKPKGLAEIAPRREPDIGEDEGLDRQNIRQHGDAVRDRVKEEAADADKGSQKDQYQ